MRKYTALAGFLILLLSAVAGAVFSLDAMWPVALLGTLVWVVAGAMYRNAS